MTIYNLHKGIHLKITTQKQSIFLSTVVPYQARFGASAGYLHTQKLNIKPTLSNKTKKNKNGKIM